ncbi:hypothetical protein F3Y22_tig00111769pilonHSYRG00400 [Hibiscus syriacus]|uniref:Uncharacterized protein n=1 Tax=Hibiscus syriacus TaxID=106335 RepID=A0A6A2YHF0_HIBSY|nr:hypothetical protein F3Y22_tig00111769pilonHSYRG00400 [Hibiscus syriacus]
MVAVIQITQTQLPLKLTNMNFPSWFHQIEALLIGLDLTDYITGDTPCPPKIIDKLIVHAIGSSLSEFVLPMIARSATSMEALNKLIVVFSSKIKSRAIALKRLLTMLTQGNKLVAEFLQTTNTLADELALAQASILDDELVIHIFSGIIPKLNDIVTTLKARETTLTYEEVFDKLIDHENDLKRQEEGLISPLSVNYVRGRGSHSSRPPNKGNYCGNTFDPNFRN